MPEIFAPNMSSALLSSPPINCFPISWKMPFKAALTGLATTFTFCVLRDDKTSLAACCCTGVEDDFWSFPRLDSLTASLTASVKLFSSCLLNFDSAVIAIVLLESPFNLRFNSSRFFELTLTLIGLLSKCLLTCLRCCASKLKRSFKIVNWLSLTTGVIGLLLK